MESIYRKLEGLHGISTVAKDRVEVLRPQDTQRAIGAQDLSGCSCLVLMGTSPKPAIMMARISASDSEEHYMSMVRLMISIFTQEHELFQLPLAWAIFSHHPEDGFPLNCLQERTSRVFQHLHVRLQISFYGKGTVTTAQSSLGRHTVVTVQQKAELPEIYIDNHLVYPEVHSGSLALELDRLGLKQIDRELAMTKMMTMR